MSFRKDEIILDCRGSAQTHSHFLKRRKEKKRERVSSYVFLWEVPLSHFQWLLLGSCPRMSLHFSVSSCPSLNIQDQIHPKGPLERGSFHICETVLLGLLWNLLKDEAKQPDRATRN
ncbi:rCG63704 [Rattus norvegicus]|uniref:RCG63704 n=1 Tax=Rattus norvegicus TaxID=10116 RepID=A6IG58_RAT|nr:rCG63704 [Rattus norvegicus]